MLREKNCETFVEGLQYYGGCQLLTFKDTLFCEPRRNGSVVEVEYYRLFETCSRRVSKRPSLTQNMRIPSAPLLHHSMVRRYNPKCPL